MSDSAWTHAAQLLPPNPKPKDQLLPKRYRAADLHDAAFVELYQGIHRFASEGLCTWEFQWKNDPEERREGLGFSIVAQA